MAQGIPEEIIDQIREQSDLVTLVGEYIKLERRGKNMLGLCPFHNEKTPSFSVSAEKQLYHCFGCGASGNVFSLVMELEKLTFPEAARFLAKRAGIKIPEREREAGPGDQLKDKIYNLNLAAARYYQYQLLKTTPGKKALNYLLKRGINRQTIETFMLGYAPGNWTGFFNFASKKGASPELLVKAGLVSPGKEKSHYDRFRNRIIFPIFTLSGKVAGFGGRLLEEKEKGGPKYLNSPETLVYNKSSILYGLNFAREEIRRQKKAVVMEGYTDVITAYQAGIKNVVASLGTALTAEQGRLLRNQADLVITAYDSDSAGQAATWRGLAVLQSTGCLVQVAELPEGSDPDSLIRKQGADAFKIFVEKSVPLIEYRLIRLRERYDLKTEVGRLRYIEELMPFLVTAVNQVERDYYLKKAAEEIGVEEAGLRGELKKFERKRFNRDQAGQTEKKEEVKPIVFRPAEKILLSLTIQSKEIAEQGRNLIKSGFLEDERVQKVFNTLWQLYDAGEAVSAEKLLDMFEDEETKNFISRVATDPALQDLQPKIAKRMAEDSFDYLQRLWSARQQLELKKRIKELEALGDEKQIEQLLREHQDLITNKDGSPNRSGKGGDFNG